VTAICGLTLPRLEQEYLAAYSHGMSVASAQATLSAIASGMMALTGIVFALDTGCVMDDRGDLRLIFPTPAWEDYLALALDEIRQYGASSVQVMRRLRSALLGPMDSVAEGERKAVVRRYLHHLNVAVEHSALDAEDQVIALQEDRRGLGLSRRRAEPERDAVTGR
jgi:uncharacterized membrane protein